MNEPTVTLHGQGVGDRQFPLDHAQRILDLPSRPKVWTLNDNLFEMQDGKIILRPNTGDNHEAEEQTVD